jgi:hypothetical protein
MFAFNLLGVDFPDSMSSGGEMAILDPSRIRIEMHQPERLEQFLQLDKHLIRATPEHICQDHPRQMVNRMPQPALMHFTLHETPHLIDFCRLDPADLYRGRVGIAPCHDAFINWRERAGLFFNSPITVLGLTCSTRAISRTPLPLRVISTICRFTSGNRPGYAYVRMNVRPHILVC